MSQTHLSSSAASAILADLKERFPNRISITRKTFRDLMGISPSLDARLRKAGQYPKLIAFATAGGRSHYLQILLTDLAEWLASTRAGSEDVPMLAYKLQPGKKRGRPIGSKNKPKAKETEHLGLGLAL